MKSKEILPLPCPFCNWEKIRVMVSESENELLKGSEYSYCWCKVCGTRGPTAYTCEEPDNKVALDAITRWNEREGKAQ